MRRVLFVTAGQPMELTRWGRWLLAMWATSELVFLMLVLSVWLK